jgi:hypothetical protein
MDIAAILSFNTRVFLLWLLECRKCHTSHLPITPRASLATTGNWKEHHFQQIRYEEKVKVEKILVQERGEDIGEWEDEIRNG